MWTTNHNLSTIEYKQLIFKEMSYSTWDSSASGKGQKNLPSLTPFLFFSQP